MHDHTTEIFGTKRVAGLREVTNPSEWEASYAANVSGN